MAEEIESILEEHPYLEEYSPEAWEFIVEFEEGLEAMADYLDRMKSAVSDLTREEAERDEMLSRVWETEKERLGYEVVARIYYDEERHEVVVEHVLKSREAWEAERAPGYTGEMPW